MNPSFARLQFEAPAVLVYPLASFFVNQFNLRSVNFVLPHARFARLNLRLKRTIELVECHLLQIYELRQTQIVEFLEMVSQGRVHLGFASCGIQHVIVTNPFFLESSTGRSSKGEWMRSSLTSLRLFHRR